MKKKYPHLYELFAGYFHQDWTDDLPTAVDVVERYLGEFSIDDINETLKELDRILNNVPAESELVDLVHKLGSYYNPAADGLTYRAWLTQVHKLLEGRSM